MKTPAILLFAFCLVTTAARADAEFWLWTGQSNISQLPAYSWTPPSNAKVWNNNIDGSSVGNLFTALDSTTMSVQAAFVAERARLYPSRTIYLVQVGLHDSPIARWFIGGPQPNLWSGPTGHEGIVNIVPAALAASGLTAIAGVGWWQWESDALAQSTTWPADFQTVVNQFGTQSWFAANTPLLVFGGAGADQGSPAQNADDFMNTYVMKAVHNDPVHRRYINAAAWPASAWITSPAGHMTAQGYYDLGTAVADAFSGQAVPDGLWTLGTRPLNDWTWSTWTPTINPGNGIFVTPPTLVKATYREIGSLIHLDVGFIINSNTIVGGGSGTTRFEVSLPLVADHSTVCSAVNGYIASGLAAYILDDFDRNKIVIFTPTAGYPPTAGKTLVSCDYQRGSP